MTEDKNFKILCLETGKSIPVFEGVACEREFAFDVIRSINDWSRRKRLYIRKVDVKDEDVISEWVHQDQRKNNQIEYRVVLKKHYK